jgi:hypothetical protein
MKKTILILGSILLYLTFASNKSYNENSIINDVNRVSVCRYCSLVVQFPISDDRLYPDNRQISQRCNQWQGHMWYNAGTSGQNAFRCKTCGVIVSIQENKPRCLTFCEEACKGKSMHKWVKLN